MEKLKTLLIANRGEIAVRDSFYSAQPPLLGKEAWNNYLTKRSLPGPHH